MKILVVAEISGGKGLFSLMSVFLDCEQTLHSVATEFFPQIFVFSAIFSACNQLRAKESFKICLQLLLFVIYWLPVPDSDPLLYQKTWVTTACFLVTI